MKKLSLLHSSPNLNFICGCGYGVFGAISYAAMAVVVAVSNKDLTSNEFIFYRSLTTLLFLSMIDMGALFKLFNREALIVWLRGISGGIAVYIYFFNLRLSSAGAATAIHELAALFVVLFEIISFGQKKNFLHFFAAVAVCLGVALIGLEKNSNLSVTSTMIGLVGAFFAAIAYISLQKSTKAYSTISIIWTIAICMFVISLFFEPVHDLHRLSSNGEKSIFLASIFSLSGQFFTTRSFALLNASSAAIISTSAIMWTFLFNCIDQSFLPSCTQLFGIVFLVSGLIGVVEARFIPARTDHITDIEGNAVRGKFLDRRP